MEQTTTALIFFGTAGLIYNTSKYLPLHVNCRINRSNNKQIDVHRFCLSVHVNEADANFAGNSRAGYLMWWRRTRPITVSALLTRSVINYICFSTNKMLLRLNCNVLSFLCSFLSLHYIGCLFSLFTCMGAPRKGQRGSPDPLDFDIKFFPYHYRCT